MTETPTNLTQELAHKLLRRMAEGVIRNIVEGKELSEDDSAEVLVAGQLLHDHTQGHIDLNTWAEGAAFRLIWKAIRHVDPQTYEVIEAVVNRYADAAVPPSDDVLDAEVRAELAKRAETSSAA